CDDFTRIVHQQTRCVPPRPVTLPGPQARNIHEILDYETARIHRSEWPKHSGKFRQIDSESLKIHGFITLPCRYADLRQQRRAGLLVSSRRLFQVSLGLVKNTAVDQSDIQRLAKSEIRWKSLPILRPCKSCRQHEDQKQSLNHRVGTSIAD